MKHKHKHCDIIKAWADGEEIQYFSILSQGWITIKNPSWDEDEKYRVKPKEEFLKYKVALFKSCTGEFFVDCYTPDQYDLVEDGNSFIAWILDEQTVNVGWLRTEK